MENIKQKKNEKHSDVQKISLQILIVVFSLVILISSLITLGSTIKASNLAFGDYRFYIMESTSEPYIAKVGDLVIAKKAKLGEVKIGDSIVYSDNKFFYCDNITKIKKNNTIEKIITAEKDGVRYQFNESNIQGKVVKVIPELGSVVAFLRTPLGIIIFILFIACLFITLMYLINNSKKAQINNK